MQSTRTGNSRNSETIKRINSGRNKWSSASKAITSFPFCVRFLFILTLQLILLPLLIRQELKVVNLEMLGRLIKKRLLGIAGVYRLRSSRFVAKHPRQRTKFPFRETRADLKESPPNSGGEQLLVGAPRFELGTSRTRTVRSTGLSHAPKAGRIILFLAWFCELEFCSCKAQYPGSFSFAVLRECRIG